MFVRMLRRLPAVTTILAGLPFAARSSDRAVYFWGLAICAAAALAIFEGNAVAAIAAAAAIPMFPGSTALLARFGLCAAAVAAVTIGPIGAMFAVPAALLIVGLPGTAAASLLSLASTALLAHHLQSVPIITGFSIHPASIAFVVIPTIAALASFGPKLGWRKALLLLVSSATVALVINLGAGRWITYSIFTSPFVRTAFALAPICLILAWVEHRPLPNSERGLGWLVASAGIGIMICLLLPASSINRAVFDEAHGRWATVRANFGPKDFGRAVNYTYSLLGDYSKRLLGDIEVAESEDNELPPADSVFILKMPTQKISSEFSLRLYRWVRDGGRLLVIADHTDLYDSAQNLNAPLLALMGISINSDAVFDSRGMPNEPVNEKALSLIGRIDAVGNPFPWQTGTSFGGLPLNAAQLATFGVSFSEPGDYSRPNRFGPFVPRVSLRYLNHTAVAAFGVGNGAVAVILDSTPWSTFSIFKEQYKQLFRGILGALSRPLALHVWGWGALVLGLATLVSIFWRHPSVIALGGFALGLALGAATQIGFASLLTASEGRDFGLKVAVGSTAKLEFLKQLVAPGERNFSRIISALSKYGFDPSASSPGWESPRLGAAKRWLLIQPDERQLPPAEQVIEHLRRGRDLAVLFAPEQAALRPVREWIQALGLVSSETVALATGEDSRGTQEGFLNRRGSVLLRDTRTLTQALPTSLLKENFSDQFVQSYTVRPTLLPRTSGMLNLSFSADQFSDAAVGDVWEGIQPSSIGRLREQQLASALAGNDLPQPFPLDLYPSAPGVGQSRLSSYLVLEDGKAIISGKLEVDTPNTRDRALSPLDNPAGYLSDLKTRAISFIEQTCPKSAKITQCRGRMLGPDMIEWAVSWASEDDGNLLAVELLHERSFSGLGRTLNVVFAR